MFWSSSIVLGVTAIAPDMSEGTRSRKASGRVPRGTSSSADLENMQIRRRGISFSDGVRDMQNRAAGCPIYVGGDWLAGGKTGRREPAVALMSWRLGVAGEFSG